jgi:hypothetical protein
VLGPQLASDHTLACLSAEVRNARTLISTRDTPFNFEHMRIGDRQQNVVHNDSVPLRLITLNTLVRALFTRLNSRTNLLILFLVFLQQNLHVFSHTLLVAWCLGILRSGKNMPCWDSVVGVVAVLLAGRTRVRISAG